LLGSCEGSRECGGIVRDYWQTLRRGGRALSKREKRDKLVLERPLRAGAVAFAFQHKQATHSHGRDHLGAVVGDTLFASSVYHGMDPEEEEELEQIRYAAASLSVSFL